MDLCLYRDIDEWWPYRRLIKNKTKTEKSKEKNDNYLGMNRFFSLRDNLNCRRVTFDFPSFVSMSLSPEANCLGKSSFENETDSY